MDSNNDLNLGKLERIQVREAWSNEAQDFTPWLADNLDLLGEQSGIKLELEDSEVQTGSYRADIVARIPQNNSIVVIENQLETADLQHLGQILAYMSGLDGHIVVWVAADFKDIHRTAIRWLNEHTADPFAFFAVQIYVVRIGESPLAPVFEILERPNEWERQVQDASKQGEISKNTQFRCEFWEHFMRRIPGASGLMRPGYAHSNVWIPVAEADLTITLYIDRNSVGVYIRGNWSEPSTDATPRIEPYVEAIRNSLDEDDVFSDLQHYRCLVRFTVNDSHDRANWDQMADWLNERRMRYEKILREI